MSLLFRRVGIVVLACITAVVMLGIIILFATTITLNDQSPYDFLPLNETVAVFSNRSEEEIDVMTTFFPILREATPGPGKTIAIVKIEDEAKLIELQDKRVRDDVGQTIRGVFAITTSDDTTTTLLEGVSPALSTDPSLYETFRTLDSKSSSILLTRKAVEHLAGGSDTLLSSFVPENTSHVFIAQSPEAIQTTFVNATSKKSGVIPFVPLPNDNDSLLFRGSLERVLNILSYISDDALIVRSLLEKKLEELFSDTISLQYDIAKLTKNPVTVRVRTQTGATNMILEGTYDSTRELKSNLAALHHAHRATRTTTKIVERNLLDRFTSRDVRMDEHALSLQKDVEDPWSVTRTLYNGETSLLTAQHGKKFVLTNSEDMWNSILLAQSDALEIPSQANLVRTLLIGGGKVTPESLQWLHRHFPIDFSLPLPTLTEYKNRPFLWTVTQRNYGQVLTIEGRTD